MDYRPWLFLSLKGGFYGILSEERGMHMETKTSAIRKRHTEIDMTRGSIFMHLLRFMLPLLAGNIFQQLYNMVDTWVVGNYASNEAFSAVGSAGPITFTLIGFFMGLSNGAGVITAQYFGAGKPESVQKTVHTAILMTLILAVLFTGVGIAFTPTMLVFMQTPEEVLPEAVSYLTIYFAGVSGLMLYNVCSGILQAVGNSLIPFLALLACALMNTVLDLYFVIGLGMGVEGVALATIIAQYVSAVLVLIALMRTDSCIRFRFRKLAIDKAVLGRILRVGFPAALQMAVTSFSNVFVQSYINHFGADVMSGWTAYNKIDQLLVLPTKSMALAATTFVGQNLGAGQEKRARTGMKAALGISLGLALLLGAPSMLFAPSLVGFFNPKAEVIAYGASFLMLTPFYVFMCINQVTSGALRGAGNSRAPMVIMLGSYVFFRQIYLYVMTNFISNTVMSVAFGYPLGWIVCSTAMILYYLRHPLRRVELGEAPAAAAEAETEEKADPSAED